MECQAPGSHPRDAPGSASPVGSVAVPGRPDPSCPPPPGVTALSPPACSLCAPTVPPTRDSPTRGVTQPRNGLFTDGSTQHGGR